jgi:transposase-like protein
MYARGMSVHKIRSRLQELHGTQVSPDLMSTITDVLDGLSNFISVRGR